MSSRLENRMSKLEENNPKGKKVLRFIIKSDDDEQVYQDYLKSADKDVFDDIRVIRVHRSKWAHSRYVLNKNKELKLHEP